MQEQTSIIPFREAHFFGLMSQSNLYGMTKLYTSQTSNKILVATLRNPTFYTLEFVKSNGLLLPYTKEIHFTYIPSGAEIISIDAFNKSQLGNDFVIGITFIKMVDNQTTSHYLNIYFDWESGPEFNLDTIAQSCSSVALAFIPYQLYHTRIFNDGVEEVVWLLSGSDAQVHLYREDKTMHKFLEHPIAQLFPEFENIPSIVLRMNIVHINSNDNRLTVFGCEDGYVRLACVKTRTNEITASWSICHDGPVTFVQLFTSLSPVKVPQFLNPILNPSGDESEFHLLVTNSLEPSVVYRNVVKCGLENQLILPESDYFDCVICACIADINMDGCNEIILGTYGQEVLVYKYNGDDFEYELKSTSSEDRDEDEEAQPEYSLIWQKSLANPLHGLFYIDFTGDGMKELVILSLKGIHVLQHSPEEAAELCINNLSNLLKRVKKYINPS